MNPKHSNIPRFPKFIIFLLCIGLADFTPGAENPIEQSSPLNLTGYFGFGPMEILKLQWGLVPPIVADINKDGLNDLVVINNRKARIEILLQKKDFQPGRNILLSEIEDDDVNDIFGKERTWRFKRFSYPLDIAVYSLVVADFNQDDYLDLAFYAKDGLRIVLQQIPGKKDNSPRSPSVSESDSTTPRQPVWTPARKIDIREGLTTSRSLTNGDINGDGLTDLALLAGDGAFILLQNPDGTIAEPTKYYSASNKLKQIDIADINGDKRSDLVFLTSQHEEFPLRIRFQSPKGQLGPELRYHLPVPALLEIKQLDNSPKSHFISVSKQSGRVLLSTLSFQSQQEAFPVYTYPLPATEKPEHRDIVAADVDGDGLLDVVVSDPSRAEFLLYRAESKTSLTTPESFPGLKDMRKLCAGDLDNSGQDTIVVLSFEEKLIALSKLRKGRLSFPETISVTGEPQAMDLADVNGDKQLDLIYIAKEKGTGKTAYFLRTIVNLGRKNAEKGPELELTQIKDKPLDMKAADIDHDGRTDVMIIRSYGPLLLVRQRTPDVFEQELNQSINSGLVARVYPHTLSLAPLGPEGKTAALLVQKNFARALIFDSDRGWQVVDQYQAAHSQSNLTTAIACRLAPGDSSLDIVTYDSARGKLALLSQQPDGTYRPTRQINIGFISAKKILVGNFGSQAPVSLLLCGNNKLIRIPVNDPTFILRQITGFEPDIKNGRFGALTVGDINGDSYPEIILCEQARHHVQILTFNSVSQLVNGTKFKVFEQPRGGTTASRDEGRRKDSGEPRAVTIGDVTGDGKNDLILLVHDRIIIYPQD